MRKIAAPTASLFGAVVLLAVGPGAPAHAQSAPPAARGETLTLSAAIAEALRNRPLLAGDSERVAAARARVTQARAGLLPRVDLQASATDGPLGAPAMGLGGLVGTPIKKHTGGSLNLVQTLLDFGRTQNTVKARSAEVEASQAGLRSDRNRVVLEVEQAFFQALQSRRLAAVNRQILEQRRLVARQAETFRRNGLTSRVDVDLAEAGVAQAELALVRAENEVENALAALGTALGRPVESGALLDDPVRQDAASAPNNGGDPAGLPRKTEPPLPALEASLAAALHGRPELQQGSAQVRVFEHLTSAARAGRLPQLTGVGSVGKINPVPLFAAGDKEWAVGLALTVPIFTGHLVDGQVEEARRNANAARENLHELSNAVRQQVTAALNNLAAARAGVRVAETQFVRAQDALSLATQRYQAQLGTIVELTQAQSVFASAQYDLVRAQYDRELARAAVDYVIGRDYAAGTDGSR